MIRDWLGVVRRLTSTHRREAILVGAALGLAYWALQLSVPRALGAFHDDAVYVALGRAIAQRHGYHSIYAAGNPVHLRYPPGLPLIFAVLWTVGRTLPVVAGLAGGLSIAATSVAAGLVWWIARAKLGLHPWTALVWSLGPFLLDSALLYFSLPISEPYFVLGWAVALVLAYRLSERPSLPRAAVLGLVIAAAVLTRTQALAVLAGLLGAMMLQRIPWRATVTFLVAALLPMAVWGLAHGRMAAAGPLSSQPDEASYLSWVPVRHAGQLPAFLVAAIRVNWGVYWDQIPRHLTDVKMAGVVLLAAALALAIGGGVVLGRRHTALTLSVAANAAVLLLWPWPQDRFVFAMLPFAGLLTAAAVDAAVVKAVPRVRLAVYATLGLFALSVASRQTTLRTFAYLPVGPRRILGFPYPGHFIVANTRFVLTVSQWLRDQTTPQDRVLSDAPAAIYLYAGRQAVAALPAQSPIGPSFFDPPGAYLAGRILADSVSVVVLTQVTHPLARDVATLVERCPGVLEYAGNAQWWGASRAFFYRVHSSECLRQIMVKAPR